MTSKYELMRHALGVHQYGSRWKKPYRNHFVAGGEDAAIWDGLVAEGLAVLARSPGPMTGGDPLYACTDEGKRVAVEGIRFARRWGYGQPVNI